MPSRTNPEPESQLCCRQRLATNRGWRLGSSGAGLHHGGCSRNRCSSCGASDEEGILFHFSTLIKSPRRQADCFRVATTQVEHSLSSALLWVGHARMLIRWRREL